MPENRKVLCVVSSFSQNCPNKKRNPKCANCRGPHAASCRGCPAYKDQAFRQHVVQNQVSYTSILKQASLHLPATHSISLLIKLSPGLRTWYFKSLCHSFVPKTFLKSKCRPNPICQNKLQKQLEWVNINGKDVFESIILCPAPPPPAPFVFSSTLVRYYLSEIIVMDQVQTYMDGPRHLRMRFE